MKKTFTLIELIVVIAIIAILAAIIAPNAFKAIEKAKVSNVIGVTKAIKTALYSYYADTGQWPPKIPPSGGVVHTYLNTTSFLQDDGVAGWDGPYLEKWNTNHPWGGTWFVRIDTVGDNELDPSVIDIYLGLNNDPPAPLTARQKIDSVFDDDNLATGSIREACVGSECELYISVATTN